MPSAFEAKKAKILAALQVPDQEYTDLSPKGAVDSPVRELVRQINATADLVTTSSCSGRIVVYAEGTPQKPATTADPDPGSGGTTTQSAADTGSSQGKGGGHWFFVSHVPVELSDTFSPNRVQSESSFLSTLLSHSANEVTPTSISITPLSTARLDGSSLPPGAALVHLKFEPLILHVMASSLAAARLLLIAAQAAGFRESGLASVPAPVPERSPDHAETTFAADPATTDGQVPFGPNKRVYPRRPRKSQKQSSAGQGPVMVAIRTTGLAMDAPIGYILSGGRNTPAESDKNIERATNDEADELRLVVGHGYIESLVALGNARFVTNEERKTRLSAGLIKAFGQRTGT